MPSDSDYKNILKTVRNLHEEPLGARGEEAQVNAKKSGATKFGIYIAFIISFLLINTGLFFLYDLYIYPTTTWMPHLNWFTMLAMLVFYHTFKLTIFQLPTIISNITKN